LENTLDITKSAQLFGLLSRLENETEGLPVVPSVIDGIQIHNRFLKNSFKGTMLTDEIPWSDETVLVLNKIHGLSRTHKASGTHNFSAELGGQLANDYKSEMNEIIYHGYMLDELNVLLDASLKTMVMPKNLNKSSNSPGQVT